MEGLYPVVIKREKIDDFLTINSNLDSNGLRSEATASTNLLKRPNWVIKRAKMSLKDINPDQPNDLPGFRQIGTE